MYYIYIIENLLDPTKLYVGLTKDPDKRWKRHASNARSSNSRKKSYIHHAIAVHGEDNFAFTIITVCDTLEEAHHLECYWISSLRENNLQLYNLTDGGEVPPTNVVWSDETRRAASERMSGKNNYFYGKQLFGPDNGNYGKKMKPHVKATLLQHRAKLTPQQVQEIRDLYQSGNYTQVVLAKQFGVAPPQIHCIVRNKSWNDGTPEPQTKPRLTPDQVREIRRLYADCKFTGKELGAMFGVSNDHISGIVTRRIWKNVT